MIWGYIVNLVTRTVKEWIEDDTMTYSAALAFYFILSFPALLLFSASIGKFFTDKNTFRSALIGLVPIFWSASNIFRHLKNFLKIEWEPDPNEKNSGIRSFSEEKFDVY